MSIEEALDAYCRAKPGLSKGWIRQLRIAVNLLNRYTGVTSFEQLDEDRIDEFRNRLAIFGRKPKTINNKVNAIAAIWRFARKRGYTSAEVIEVEPLRVPKRIPRAWNGEEMSRLLAACDRAPQRRTWGPRHWRALVLVIYDTSLRVGCLLAVPRSVIQGEWIWISAEYQKGDGDTVHRLHPDTLAAIEKLPRNTRRLFAWPYHENDIWARFRDDILEPAGLPATRRDKFHKIRRTSYTLVFGALGPQAASEHAAHCSDLSKNYLDPTLIDRPDPISVLPRPGKSSPTPTGPDPAPILRVVG